MTFKRISACCSSRRLAKMGPYNGYRTKPRANCKLSRKKITM
jgi:hypothetical protein